MENALWFEQPRRGRARLASEGPIFVIARSGHTARLTTLMGALSENCFISGAHGSGCGCPSNEPVDKADGVVFRWTLSDTVVDRWLEVPNWTFDREVS
jgi:hypothetical protein